MNIEAARLDYAAVIIGSGSAGLTVAVGLAGLGRDVAVVERGPVGGDCTNVGCIPSKTLIHLARNGVADPWREIRRRRDALEHEEATTLERDPRVDLIRGRARVSARGEVTVLGGPGSAGEVTLRAPHVVVASGSRPNIVEIPGLGPDRTLTNETFFDIDSTPSHLLIVGGGAIAVELAMAVRGLGAEVTVVEAADRLLPREDPDASAIILDALRGSGIATHLGTTVERFEERSCSIYLANGERVGNVERVLLALGRRPRIETLGLEALGVGTVPVGVTVDSWGRTSVRGIWAVGDVTGRTSTTHGANAMARRTVRAIGLPRLLRFGRPPVIPSVVFTEPEVASVGVSHQELERRWPTNSRLRIRVDLAETDRGLTDDVTLGAVIVDVERFTGRVLRATIVGPAAAEAIGIFTLAIDRHVSMHRLYRLVHPYPTFASAIGRVADEFTRQTLPHLGTEARAWLRTLPTTARRSS